MNYVRRKYCKIAQDWLASETMLCRKDLQKSLQTKSGHEISYEWLWLVMNGYALM